MIIGTAQESKGYALIALIICGCIIPARGVIRGFLHIGNGMGMELAGFGTIMGATSLMRSIGSGIGAAAGALAHASADAKSDKINADMTDDLADVQKKQDLEDINKGEALQSEMEDIIGENPDLDMDDAETSFAFGYQPTPKEEMHEKSPHAQAAATAQNIASGIDALGRKKDSLNEHIRSNDSKIASIGEEIAMDNEQIASMKAEKQAIQAEQNEQKNGGIPRRRTDMRGSGNWIRELVKRSIHAPYVWRNSPGSAVRMPGQRKKLDVLMLYRPGPGVRFHHPEAVLEAV